MIVSFLLAGAGAWIATQSAAEREIRERVQLEMNALQEEIRLEGLPAALTAIHTRAESPGALEYRVSDRNGRVLFGDLPIAEASLGWHFFDLPREDADGRPDDFILLTATTADGTLLTIGDDLERAEGVRLAVLGAILWVGAGALALGLLGGALATVGRIRRMDALTSTMQRVSAGDLSARINLRPRGDDIDVITHGVNDMLEQIDLLVANVRRVSTNIAHDMRTPLAHVRQELEAAALAANQAETQEAVRRAQGKIDDVLRIFSAMLRLAEIEGGSIRSRFVPVDLAAVVERVTGAFQPDIDASGRTLHVGPLTPALVQGDADLIAQALSNLLENAMRHTPPETAISVRLAQDENGARLEVGDEGPGVPESERERILKPFERVESARSILGAGLGLSIANAIVRAHRATLTLHDAEPGLRVTIAWPATLVIPNTAAT